MSDFLNGKKILITGAGGFIGSHLAEALVSKGATLRAFVRYNSRNDPGLLTLLEKNTFSQIEVIPGDLRDLSALTEATSDIDCVVHLGAMISIPYSYLHPKEVVESNVLGTLNILLACRQNQVERLVHISSSEVYGTALEVPINENHALQGQSPYSASKIGADKLAESFHLTYGLPVVTIRPFNTYGPRQSTRAVIPGIITQALTQTNIKMGNLNTSRDFTFISDTVEGIISSIQTPEIEGKTLNLGSGTEIKIGDLAEKIIEFVGRPVKIIIDSDRIRPEKSEVNRLVSDNHFAYKSLGWNPKVNIDSGLQKTIEWYRENIHMHQNSQHMV